MLLAHKIALDPNAAQRIYFARAAGCARFAWNWALAEWQRQYKAGEKPNALALRRQLNNIKRDQFPWMLEVTKTAPQTAIVALGDAFKRFFQGKAKYPRFKKKGVHDSFRADNGPAEKGADAVQIDGRRIRLPVIGWVKMFEKPRFRGQIKSATVSRTADRWFVSLLIDTEVAPVVRESQAAVGVDLGVKALATLSTGETIAGPKAHKVLLGRLRRLSRSLSRKVKGSANRRKAAAKLARLHYRISCMRQDATHKLTTRLTREFAVIGIEDLNVRGMSRNRHLARSVMDGGFYELRRQLGYKAALYGSQIVVADRWYPSSKTCSDCGYILSVLALSEREWICPACGSVHDRDHNAAANLERLAASSAVIACGAEGSGDRLALVVKPAAVKQELSDVLFGHA